MGFLFEVKNLCRSFKLNDNKSISILNNLNFCLPSKGMFFIYGKSGCGKSTLLSILEGIMEPTSGEVFFNGKKYSNKDVSNEIGIIFQSFNLIKGMSVKQNLILAKKIKGIKNNKQFDLEKLGISNLLNKKIETLSGGEKQRVCLARAIIGSPKVIFADEPTGNLDKENTKIIFDLLKEISKKILVVVVTHNSEILKEYNDGFLNLNNGVQNSYKEIKNNTEEVQIKRNKKCKNKNFVYYLIGINFKRNFKKNIVSFLAVSFSLLVILLSISFNNGILNNSISIARDFKNYNSFKISKIENETVNDSNFTLQRLIKPNIDEILNLVKDYNKYEIKESYEFFFSGRQEVFFKNLTLDNIEFIPVNNLALENHVYVNNFFLDYFKNKTSDNYLGTEFSLHLKKEYLFNNFGNEGKSIIKENFDQYIAFKIEKVVNEFSYLNNPKVYFSSDYFQKYLKNYKCFNINKEINSNYTFYDLLSSNRINEEVRGFSYTVFLDSFDDSKRFFENRKQFSSFKIVNEPFEIMSSFKELSGALFKGVVFFIVVSISCSCAIISFLSYSNFILNKKESAILSVLGAKNEDVYKVYVYEQCFIGLLAFLIIVPSYLCLEKYINLFIKKAIFFDGILKYSKNINLYGLILFFIISVIFVFIYLPLKISKKKELYKELKEE